MPSTLVLAAGFVVWDSKDRGLPPHRYVATEISRGDVAELVRSTGTVQPLTEVQVGAQISGRIAKVFVDFNAVVHKGDVLAEIDTTLLRATVESNRAQLAAARAQLGRSQATLSTAEAALARLARLRVENLASQADVDQARGQRDVALADVAAARAQIVQNKAQLTHSKTNYLNCRIYAPIDGIVISRNVDPGQTVAASFQAPTLFVIAEDMRRMRILAEVNQGDIGKLREGMVAEATVEGFAEETFSGTVNQVRFNPKTVQGAVTYQAVIDVDNPDLKLRPGMTATVRVRVRQAQGVLLVPNAALQFEPSRGEGSPRGEASGEREPTGPGKGRVYTLSDATPGREQIEPKIVAIGITDGVFTELKPTDPEVTKVVTGEAAPSGAQRKFLWFF